MADLSPFRGDSKASRQPLFCIPVDSYAFDDANINITLQSVLAAVVADLNQLATEGIPTENGESGPLWNRIVCFSLGFLVRVRTLNVNFGFAPQGPLLLCRGDEG